MSKKFEKYILLIEFPDENNFDLAISEEVNEKVNEIKKNKMFTNTYQVGEVK